MPHVSGLTCVHQPPGMPGLCAACKEEWGADWESYLEFGAHPDGLRRWAEEEALMRAWEAEQRARAEAPPVDDSAIPF
jgi:hypothetical protein